MPFPPPSPERSIGCSAPSSSGFSVSGPAESESGMSSSTSSNSASNSFETRLLELTHKRLEKFASLFPRVLVSDHPDPIHDTRVWSRRLQQIFNFLFPKPRNAKARKLARLLRRVRRALGLCRNLDVSLDKIQHRMENASSSLERDAWGSIRDYAQEKRAAEILRARKELARYDIVAFVIRTQALLELAGFGRDVEDTLKESIAKATQDWTEALNTAKDHEDRDTLHGLRVAGKRLRYRIELLAQLGESSARTRIKSLRALQDQLGDWHDCYVMLQLVAEFIGRPDFLVDHPEIGRTLLTEMERERHKNEEAVTNILKNAEKIRPTLAVHAS
jgi:CHAD domain-containing protein